MTSRQEQEYERYRVARKLRIDPPRARILQLCRDERIGRERLMDVAERLLLFDVMVEAEMVQGVAAQILGITPRALNYRLSLLGWRPVDG